MSSLEYNTARGKLVLKEYGRYVQTILEKCLQEKDREKRSHFAKEIVDLMGVLNPQLRSQEDFKFKIWDHLMAMSDYQLDIDAPVPLAGKEKTQQRPALIPYPRTRIKNRHYGKYVQKVIELVDNTDSTEKREWLSNAIGNYMKHVYQSHTKENVTDEMIKNDLASLSGGAIRLSEDTDINSLARSNRGNFSRPNNVPLHSKGKFKKFKPGYSGGGKFFKKRPQ